jgi:hypothetical protein
MHSALYVCLPRAQARTSLRARELVCEYLTDEGFEAQGRFGGHCDYFKVGGRWSGRLTWLRLRNEQPQQFDRFWKQFHTASSAAGRKRLVRKSFPAYRGPTLIDRGRTEFLGKPDDCQIMDEPLFRQLQAGFSEEVEYEYEITKPNVIFTDDPDDDFEWPKTIGAAAAFWVVIVDYHD